MSVVTCRPIAAGRSADSPAAFAGPSKRAWQIVTNDPADNEYTIYASGALPFHGSSLPSNPFSTLRNYSWTSDGKFDWVATATYDTKPESKEERERRQVPNPLFRAAKVVVTFDDREVPVIQDINGKAILNAAGDRFLPTPTDTKSFVTIAITKNLPQIPLFFWSHKDRVNFGPVVVYTELGPIPQNFPAKSLRFRPGQISDVQEENGVRYVQCTYRLVEDPDLWQYRPLNAGFRCRRSGELVNCRDRNGQEVAEPALLDSSGGQIEDPNPDGSDAVFLSFDHVPQISFAGIPVT